MFEPLEKVGRFTPPFARVLMCVWYARVGLVLVLHELLNALHPMANPLSLGIVTVGLASTEVTHCGYTYAT